MGFIQRFFYGRNGLDQLNIALLVAATLCNLLGVIMFRGLFGALAVVILFVCIFRMISRNISKRQQENAAFLKWIQQLRTKASHRGADRANFRYFKCPACKQNLRAPKGKGKIKITCSKCGRVFYKKV